MREIPYPDSTIHVLNIDTPAFDKYMSLARDIAGKEFDIDSLSIIEMVHETDDKDIVEQETIYVRGLTTQGPVLTHMKDGNMHIQVPFLSSPWDIGLCFAICKAFKKLSPDCKVIFNDNTENELSLVEGNEDALFSMCAANMQALVDSCDKENNIAVQGVRRHFFISRSFFEQQTGDDKIWKLFEAFLDVQWNYDDYEDASLATVNDPDDDEEFTMRILTNAHDIFAGNAQKYGLLDYEGGAKLVKAEDFRTLVKDNPYVKYVDADQFVIQKMDEKAWSKLVAVAPGKYIPKTRTYIMRWNPAISSFTLDTCRNAYKDCPDGFHMDWSIYEYEKAHKGDHFYMVRVGDDKAGVVWKGVFTSDPYEGEDWAGVKGKKRMYVDIDVYHHSDPDGKPFITMEELQKAIPEIEWAKGHSGKLLTDEQGDALEELWDERMN